MSWYNKEAPTPFDNQPIDGLYFLSGDALALILLKRAELAGHDITGKKLAQRAIKCPRLGFHQVKPSNYLRVVTLKNPMYICSKMISNQWKALS